MPLHYTFTLTVDTEAESVVEAEDYAREYLANRARSADLRLVSINPVGVAPLPNPFAPDTYAASTLIGKIAGWRTSEEIQGAASNDDEAQEAHEEAMTSAGADMDGLIREARSIAAPRWSPGAMIYEIMAQNDLAGTFFSREDVTDEAGRDLTDAEWEDVRNSRYWSKGLAETMTERGWDLVHAAMGEAGVEIADV